MGLFQACVLNYHKTLSAWWGLSLSDRMPVGMMTLVYDLNPEDFDIDSPVLRRKLNRDAVMYLTELGGQIRQEFDALGKPAELSIDIGHTLQLVQTSKRPDVTLTKGEGGETLKVIEIPKDSARSHPFRQTELVEEVNRKLDGRVVINQYDIQCVTKLYNVRRNSDFFYQGSVKGSPSQYSPMFADWLSKQFEKDAQFFEKVREQARQSRASGADTVR